MEMSSWSSDFKEQSRLCDDLDCDMDYLLSGRYERLASANTTVHCNSVQSSFALPKSKNSSFCSPNQIYPINSIFPCRQVITCSCRCCDPFSDNLSYMTSRGINQVHDKNIDFPSIIMNDNDVDVGNGDDEQPKLNLTDPLMTDIAAGELDDSPNSCHEYDTLLMLPSSSSSSTSSIGYINNHCNSMCSSPTEIDFFNSSASSYANNCSNNNSNNNTNSINNCYSTISPIECSSSSSNSSCCSFKSQQCYNCINSIQVKNHLNNNNDNVSSKSPNNSPTTTNTAISNSDSRTTTITNSFDTIATDSTVIVSTSNPFAKLFTSSNSSLIYHQTQPRISSLSMKTNKPVWQMKFTRKQYVHNRTIVNSSSSIASLTRSRQLHHHHNNHYHQQQLHHYYHHQSRRRFSSLSKKSFPVNNNHIDQIYKSHPISLHYDYTPSNSDVVQQLPSNQAVTSRQGQTVQYPIHDLLSTYTFQLSPSISNNQREKLFYNDNTIDNNNSNNNAEGTVNILESKENSLMYTPVPIKKEHNESLSIRPSSSSSFPITPTVPSVSTTDSVTCKSQSKTNSIHHSINISNPVHKRLHLLQFISKLLQYSSDSSTSSSLTNSTNSSSMSSSSTSTFISSLFPTTSTSSFCLINQQPDEFILHLFNPNSQYLNCVQWIDKQARIFQIRNPQKLSQLWGYYRKNVNMTFESVSRSLRLYYVSGKLERIRGQRNQYRFLDINA
ncbi:unnamed protein product [Schistosoma rodhaini]|nr:unnamed protein product [Schistosoma rodhaini]